MDYLVKIIFTKDNNGNGFIIPIEKEIIENQSNNEAMLNYIGPFAKFYLL